jgi:hypothetical protein
MSTSVDASGVGFVAPWRKRGSLGRIAMFLTAFLKDVEMRGALMGIMSVIMEFCVRSSEIFDFRGK